MGKRLFALILFLPLLVFAQTPSDKIIRAFPITDYMVDLSDTVKIVQVQLEHSGVISEKQIGLLKSIYETGVIRPDIIGSGRCNLIKGTYYYFTINFKESGVTPKQGELLYLSVAKPSVFQGRLVKLASHYIGLTDVYESPVYDRATIFTSWTEDNEKAALDSMIKDIRFTADYFIKNEPAMNVAIKSGSNRGKLVLNVMIASDVRELNTFLEYMVVHPRKYAGKVWKISEIFATWLGDGSPTP